MGADTGITKEQLERGDLKVIYAANGTVKYAERIPPQTILTYLVDLEELTEQHAHAAYTFEVWRKAFRYPVDYHQNQLQEMIAASAELSIEGLKPQQYRDLLKMVPANTLKFVEIAVEKPIYPAIKAQIFKERGYYQHAFDALVEAIDFIRKLNEKRG